MAQAQAQHTSEQQPYFVPTHSKWPLFASVALFIAMFGLASWFNDVSWGPTVFGIGVAGLALVLMKWFADVILESVSGYYNKQVDTSFRMGMIWFIFSEIMLFAAFFGALFYTRMLSVPWLGGEGVKGVATNDFLWQGFSSSWPSAGPMEVGGGFELVSAWGLPLLNTLILLTSGVTLTIAHHALKAENRRQLLIWLGVTIILGAIFLVSQAMEYVHAYRDLNLTMGSGIYGSTFYMLTGIHGVHVTLGAIILAVVWWRCFKGHFTGENHFAFEAAAWYWHFVDVVWLALFLFVYVV
ncbi:cytochrome c oxidase subunit 3 [Luteimonas sp. JM171]|uniref:cytochrome c oxidase subunit 3 n=1 Tax=Luteimonas sp. JM171 TaxID=1896164 RepID=UPI000857D020|nr:cytochrome c oxidase subunit 3 [Luteimonas sp. JM171]AOH35621.1 MFS transporter [Luteimonas sp. JM171]